MAEITNPQVIAFSNQQVRVMADTLYSAYYHAKSLLENYNAGDIGTKIDTAGAGNLLDDGSQTDGRTRISGGDIYNFITAATDFIAYVEAGRLDIISIPHVNNF